MHCAYIFGASAGQESACNAGDPSSISECRRFPGGEHGNPLQYFLPWRIPMDRGAWRVLGITESRTQLNTAHTVTHMYLLFIHF